MPKYTSPTPQAIFFDLDGTILDWQSGMESTWLAACEEHCDDASVRARRERSSGIAPIA